PSLSRTRLDQRLLATFARSRPASLAGSRVSARECHFAHLLHDPARDRKQTRASRALSRTQLRESELGLAPHGCERPGCARVHYFSSAPFHRAQIQSAVSPA